MARDENAALFSDDESTKDLEALKPMKLSALTKALLGDNVSNGSTTPPRRSSIPGPVRPTPGDHESSWRRTRDGQIRRTPSPSGWEPRKQENSSPTPVNKTPSPSPSRPQSPVPRKRVVRLGTGHSANSAQRSNPSTAHHHSQRASLSISTRGKRPQSSDGSKVTKESPAVSQEQPAKTPVVPLRTVRIAVSSSGRKPTDGSSDVRPKYNTRSAAREAQSGPVSSTRSSAAASQSSMRVKRVAKNPGSFLSGPARRGLRRQSEEEPEAQPEVDADGSSQEPRSQHPQSGSHQDPPQSAASRYDDSAASGSPISARVSALAALRKQKSTFMSPYGQQKSEDEHLKLLYRMPAPLPQDVAKEDKENNISSKIPAAAPTSIATKNRPPSAADEKVPAQIAPPATSASIKAAPKDNDNVLAAKPHNAPQRSAAPPPPPKMSVVETATTAAGASTAASKKKQFLFRVNGRMYTRLDTLGRGASSKVYRVSAENGKILALKRVSLEGLDDRTIKGYKGEIDLLKRLSGVNRVIQLIDHEFNEEKQMLSIVLEVGELDFLTFLRSRTSEDSKFDPVFVRYWWKEMVECVQAVHAKDIIHTDLKPQNFVIAQGRLKVIDFGIANAIQTDMTVNVHRDAQVGTPNYMSPESLMDFKEYALNSANQGSSGVPLLHRPKHFKLGKSCDVWSLGCILYQLVYGMGPFGHISNVVHRIHAIINFNHQINFPETTQDGVRVPPSLIRTMRRCLQRDQSLRPSCDELLSETDPFLYPLELSPSVFAAADHGDVLPITSDLLRDVIWNVVRRCRQGNVDENEALRLWPAAYWASCKKVLAGMNASGGGGNGRQA